MNFADGMKYKWACHEEEQKITTVRTTERKERESKRSQERLKTRWRDELERYVGPTWIRFVREMSSTFNFRKNPNLKSQQIKCFLLSSICFSSGDGALYLRMMEFSFS